MPETLTPDLCVIGAGSGGLSVAAAAAAMNVSVVLIEKGEMGGDCLNVGCVPSKALIAAANAAHAMRHAEPFGILPVEPRVNFALTRDYVRKIIADIAPNDSQARFASMRVRVIRAAARFVARDICEAGEFRIRARRFVVATGSSPAIPSIPGLELVRPLTNETLFDLAELPPRLVIVGGGYIGIEMAQAFRRLGSEVTVLDSGRMLSREDPELAHPLLATLAREGVVLREGVAITRIEPRGAGVRLFLAGHLLEETVDGSHLLIAAGRRPNVEGLGLEAAGVAFSEDGVKTGAGMRTSNRRIHAIGDAAGGPAFTHAANHHAGLVLRSALFGRSLRLDQHLIPSAVFCDPEIAAIGLSEAQARAAGHKVSVLRWPFAENDRARTEQAAAGLIKVILARDGRILGAGITGRHAGEMIGLWTLAVSKRMKIADIAGLVLPYPTRGEISRRAAISAYADRLRSPWLPRLLNVMRRLG